MKKLFCVGALMALMFTGNAQSQEAKKEYGIKVGGQVFARWQWNMSNTSTGTPVKDANAFDVERFYVTASGDISEELSVNGTIDLFNTGNPGEAAMMQAKVACLDWRFASDMTLRAGLQSQPWEDLEYAIWGYRGIDRLPTDVNGYLSTADWGLGLHYALPSKMGKVSATVLNGKGFRNAEDNRFKDLAVALDLTPMSGMEGVMKKLRVVAGYYGGNTGEGTGRSRIGFGVGLPTDYVRLGLLYNMYSDEAKGTTGTIAVKGNSLTGVAEVMFGGFSADLKPLSLLFKYDSSEPDGDKSNDEFSRMLIGFVYRPTKGLYISLNNQIATYKSNSDGYMHYQQYGKSVADPIAIKSDPNTTKTTPFVTNSESKIFLQLVAIF